MTSLDIQVGKKGHPQWGKFRLASDFFPEEKGGKPTTFYGKEGETQVYFIQPRYGSSVNATDKRA